MCSATFSLIFRRFIFYFLGNNFFCFSSFLLVPTKFFVFVHTQLFTSHFLLKLNYFRNFGFRKEAMKSLNFWFLLNVFLLRKFSGRNEICKGFTENLFEEIKNNVKLVYTCEESGFIIDYIFEFKRNEKHLLFIMCFTFTSNGNIINIP